MPELPEMQALAERLDAALAGRSLDRFELLGFSGLKTARPSPEELVGRTLERVTRRGKYDVLHLKGGLRVAIHLSQAGRVDLEAPPKSTKPRGSVVRLVFGPRNDDGPVAVLVREHGTQRKAGWWVLAPGDEGPMAALGAEPFDAAFADLVTEDDSNRHLHTWLRDQRVVAGIGRGHADDILHRARRSPFVSLRSLDAGGRSELLDAVRTVLTEALETERTRTGGLSEAKLGDRFAIHGRAGQPCPRCGELLGRVSYDSYEIDYCAACQTGGRPLADRRLSRLLK
jgi:formamidopyrimidine-DNA glycosylase